MAGGAVVLLISVFLDWTGPFSGLSSNGGSWWGILSLLIALEVGGKRFSTEELAEQLQQWQMSGDNVSFLIGGPDGLSPDCLTRADQRWSLSDLTLPHPLVRVILAEQLYRAWTITVNHPYHRE